MNTPKLIMRMIDAVEAAQADIRSGKLELMAHGFASMIAIISEQIDAAHENYPEDRRIREFLAGQIRELKECHAKVAERLDKDKEFELRRAQWREHYAAAEAERKAQEKAQRAVERQMRKQRLEREAEIRRAQQEQDAREQARQGKLF